MLINQLSSDGTENFTITNSTFLAFRIDDFKGNKFDFSNLLSIKLSWVLYDNTIDKTTDTKAFGYQNCSDPKFINFFANDQIIAPNDYYCFDTGQIVGKNLFGTDDTDTLSYILFQMDICDLEKTNNVTNNLNCKYYKSARDTISNSDLFVNILYNEIVFSPSNYSTPFTQAIKKYRNSLHLNLNKNDNFYFIRNSLTQDDNFILPQDQDFPDIFSINRIENFVGFRTDDELSSIYGSNKMKSFWQSNLHNIFFKYETSFKTYSRVYLKLPDVLANLNGFMDLIVWIMGFVNVYTQTQVSYTFFNRCVKIKMNDFGGSASASASNQIQQLQRLNRVSLIEMESSRVPIKGLHHNQNVIGDAPKNLNYSKQGNLDKENSKNFVENKNEKVEIENQNENEIIDDNISKNNSKNTNVHDHPVRNIDKRKEDEKQKEAEQQQEQFFRRNPIEEFENKSVLNLNNNINENNIDDQVVFILLISY